MTEPTPTESAPTLATSPKPRGRRKVEIGMVTKDKMDKTRRVEVQRLVPHPKYGKYVKRRTICYIHDEQNDSQNGDIVEIMETRPLSKLKRWRLVRIVRKAPAHEEADAAKAAQAVAPAVEDESVSAENGSSETND